MNYGLVIYSIKEDDFTVNWHWTEEQCYRDYEESCLDRTTADYHYKILPADEVPEFLRRIGFTDVKDDIIPKPVKTSPAVQKKIQLARQREKELGYFLFLG